MCKTTAVRVVLTYVSICTICNDVWQCLQLTRLRRKKKNNPLNIFLTFRSAFRGSKVSLCKIQFHSCIVLHCSISFFIQNRVVVILVFMRVHVLILRIILIVYFKRQQQQVWAKIAPETPEWHWNNHEIANRIESKINAVSRARIP